MMETLIYSAETFMFVLTLLLVCYRIVETSQAARGKREAKNSARDGPQELPPS